MIRRTGIALLLGVLVAGPAGSFCLKYHQAGVFSLDSPEPAGYSFSALVFLNFYNYQIDLGADVCTAASGFGKKIVLGFCVPGIILAVVGIPLPGCIPTGMFWPNHSVCSNDFVAWANRMPFQSPGTRRAEGFDKVEELWWGPNPKGDGSSQRFLHWAVHVPPGETCVATLWELGHSLHVIQDFYSHSNWVEVFHKDLGFEFWDIPTWTEFERAQRGQRNLILVAHAIPLSAGDRKKAEARGDSDLRTLRKKLAVRDHAEIHKDSAVPEFYEAKNRTYHSDKHGHEIVDFHKAARELAYRESRLWGRQLRRNILQNPALGQAKWNELNRCHEITGLSLASHWKALHRAAFYSDLGGELGLEGRWD